MGFSLKIFGIFSPLFAARFIYPVPAVKWWFVQSFANLGEIFMRYLLPLLCHKKTNNNWVVQPAQTKRQTFFVSIIAGKHQQRKHQSSRSSPQGLQYLEKTPLRIQMFSPSSTSSISRTVSHSGSDPDQAVCENSQEEAAERANNSSTTKPGVFLPDRSPTTRWLTQARVACVLSACFCGSHGDAK